MAAMGDFKMSKLFSVALPATESGQDANAHAEALWHEVCDRIADSGDAGAKMKDSVREISSFLESLSSNMSRGDMDNARAQLRAGLERAYLISVGHFGEADEVVADAKKWRQGVMLKVSQRSKYTRSAAGSKFGQRRPLVGVTATHPQPTPVGAGRYARQSSTPAGRKRTTGNARGRVRSGSSVQLAASTETAGSKRRRPGEETNTPGTPEDEEAGPTEGEKGADDDADAAEDGDVEDDNEAEEGDDEAEKDQDANHEQAGGGAAGGSAASSAPVSI
jgi:hypothetical protein